MNLLEKEFLFIPVCEHTHWSLVLLCHIGTNYHTQRAKIIEIKRQIDARFEREEKIRMEKLIEREKEAANNRAGRQEHKEDAILGNELTESNELENTGVPEMSYGDVVTPCILLLDSLKAHRAQAVFPKLRKLFMALHNDKIAEEGGGANGSAPIEKQDQIVLNGRTLKGFSVSDIPRQINGWDCGLYVIHYIQHVIDNIDNLDTSWDYVSKKGKGILFKSTNIHSNVQNDREFEGGKNLFNQNDIDCYRTKLRHELSNYNSNIAKNNGGAAEDRKRNRRSKSGAGFGQEARKTSREKRRRVSKRKGNTEQSSSDGNDIYVDFEGRTVTIV